MKRHDNLRRITRKLGGFLEVCLLTLLYCYTWSSSYASHGIAEYDGKGIYLLMAVYAIWVTLIFWWSESFKFGHLKAVDIVISQCISMMVVNVMTYFQLCLIASRMIDPWPMVVLLVADIPLLVLFSYLFTSLYHRMFSARKMLMVYGDKRALMLQLKMRSRPDKYDIEETVCVDRGLDYIKQRILHHHAVVISDIPDENRNAILKFCYANGIRTYVTPKISDVIITGAEDIHLFDSPLYLIRSTGLNMEQRIAKRLMDIVLCLVALAILWPFMLLIALAIKIEDGGPVFYKQRRCTRNNEEFDILKFRSMIVDAEKDGKSIPATDCDPRITKVGRVIRALRVDELPQIFNILSGKMSVVGPRPERIEHIEKYTEEIPEFAFRCKVKGGLTGYAQVYGKYNTTPYDKLKLDLIYIEHYSFLLDCKLILTTVATLFKRESTEGFDKQIAEADLDELLESTEKTEV